MSTPNDSTLKDASSTPDSRVGSSDSSASDTPRTEARLVLCNYGECRVPADFARQLERELFAFKRSNERIIQDYNMLARDTRYAEAMQRAAERESAALTERVKLLEDQRNTLNETCHTLRAQIAGLTHMRTMKIAGLGEMVELLTSQANWDAIRDAISSPNA